MYDTIYINSYSVLKSKDLLHSTICMIRFNDLNISPYTLVYLNPLMSISTDSRMSEELGATAIAIAIISKVKNTKRKRKQKTVCVNAFSPDCMFLSCHVPISE